MNFHHQSLRIYCKDALGTSHEVNLGFTSWLFISCPFPSLPLLEGMLLLLPKVYAQAKKLPSMYEWLSLIYHLIRKSAIGSKGIESGYFVLNDQNWSPLICEGSFLWYKNQGFQAFSFQFPFGQRSISLVAQEEFLKCSQFISQTKRSQTKDAIDP